MSGVSLAPAEVQSSNIPVFATELEPGRFYRIVKSGTGSELSRDDVNAQWLALDASSKSGARKVVNVYSGGGTIRELHPYSVLVLY